MIASLHVHCSEWSPRNCSPQPFYVNPGDGAWSQLVAAKAVVPAAHVIAIINPDSGPGSSKDPGYSSGIASLVAGDIEVVG